MTQPIHHPSETTSNAARDLVAAMEPRSLRTFTPTQCVIARSSGVFHWTPEGKRLYDFSSGVLVANLGHNPRSWMRRFVKYMHWNDFDWNRVSAGYFDALPMTAYNAVTEVETEATKRLVTLLQSRPGGSRLQQVFWASTGSEAIQKALWAAMARDRSRDVILATRFGFHGKKGLAGAVTGCETDPERDPRVRFVSFPREEYVDVTRRRQQFDPTIYRKELDDLHRQHGKRIGTLITEPYLGGGGSYHPPREYLHLLQDFCRQNDIVFILDEVQSNFGRTGSLFAYETHGLEPDMVVLGKSLSNGVPVAAAVGRTDLFVNLDYGDGSDTWSANPLSCAAVLATLDEYAACDIIGQCRRSSAVIEAGLLRLKELPIVKHVRGEEGGMVWGVEMADHDGLPAGDWAKAAVLACYQGENDAGIHLLGPLAKKVLRISPPLTITEAEAVEAMRIMYSATARLTLQNSPTQQRTGSQYSLASS